MKTTNASKAGKGKNKNNNYIIETFRTEYHRCLYRVAAENEEEAEAIFDDPDHPKYDRAACELIKDDSVDAEEGVLNDVARVLLVADQPERDREGAALMALHERPEGRVVSTLCPPNQFKIHLRFA